MNDIFKAMLAAVVVTVATAILVGGAHAQDVDCNTAGSTVEMKFCAAKELDRADADLNAAWKQAMAGARRDDADWLPQGLPARADLLRDAQRKWITYRDAACDAQATMAYGGTLQPLLGTLCLTKLTEQRTADLREYAGAGR
ncbi:lysozyme inhibitor LprI family protein [Ahrensia sp. R2A130]|uniref:lysozyme inhibitor LprI family protein n=1 Tax=Ahrensia sp. R2A130 TaxID=744979 RepID=UPI0001E0ACB6|nr:lysozyme inhibitor LprI family protein [Ahrensia sp. R2A130]EFL88677.1 urease-associated protein [Ahrensia sp. R2A130]